jgi:antitoxin HicB
MTLERVYKLPLVLEPQPEGGYTITCPLIPNLITEADTLDQVQANVADALAALIEMYEDLGKPLPPALQPMATSLGTPIWVETLISMDAA